MCWLGLKKNYCCLRNGDYCYVKDAMPNGGPQRLIFRDKQVELRFHPRDAILKNFPEAGKKQHGYLHLLCNRKNP
jgi:hypothetical protein